MKNLNIGTKLLGMVSILLLLMISASGYGILKINDTNTDLKEISDQNNPLSDLVVKISITQLNQAVLFERILLLSKDPGKEKQIADAWSQFAFHSKHFYMNTEKAFQVLKTAVSNTRNVEKYEKISMHLEEIKQKHLGFEKHVEHVQMLLKKNKTDEIPIHMEEVEVKISELLTKTEHVLAFITELSHEAANNAMQNGTSSRKSMFLITLFSVIIGMALGIFLAREITGPVKQIVASLKNIANGEGDLTLRVTASGGGEILSLARWFNLFLEKLSVMIRETAGNMDILTDSSKEFLVLSKNMQDDATKTRTISDDVRVATESMNEKMTLVASASSGASQSVSSMAAAAEELNTTIDEIMNNTKRATSITEKAVGRVNDVSVKIDALGAAAKKINNVTETINEISEQTNLLSLNATIEAARAGEAGKGFAVVANEIKELAKKTADATLDIQAKVDGIQKTTSSSVKEIEAVNAIIKDINSIVSSISHALTEQSEATREIAQSAALAAEGINNMNENIAETSDLALGVEKSITTINDSAKNTAKGSSLVNTKALELDNLSNSLRKVVGQFKV